MIDLEKSGTKSADEEKARHHLGWQLTGRCNHACRYCLRRRSDKPTFELDATACAQILESYLDFVAGNGFSASIMYSGGNPMLREDLPELLERTRRAKNDGLVDHVCILANPETIDDATVAHLAACKVDLIFISLDGRREHNDLMRGEGSFDSAVSVIKKLADAGIRVNVKFTLSRCNFLDAPYVFDLTRSLGASAVGIGVMSQPQSSGDLSDLLPGPAEYREHLLSLLAYYDAANAEQKRFVDSSLRFGRGLYALLFHELGRYAEFQQRLRQAADAPFPHRGPFRGGPGDGRRRGMFVVWEDGSVHLSNPHAQPILGMVPQESFQAIHERRIAEGREESFPRRARADGSTAPENAICAACPVLEHCGGDNPSCWKLQQPIAAGK